tara:strand:- start:119 stop:430 length:312 start_codon:yes stop_codon:yes gene_type:complete
MTKYRAIKTVVDGITFASRKEATRYTQLRVLQKSGLITELELQPKFKCVVEGVKICTYIADFQYKENNGLVTVEDVKGMKTPIYKLKKKLVEALYKPMIITEV